MKVPNHYMAALFLLLGACATTGPTEVSLENPGFIEELPEGVMAIVAPNQNLQTVRVLPEDGCYWFQRTGPVETTFLPLNTREGRQICTRPQEIHSVAG
jgi:hypothetical protein